jgi:hypothetical protein
MARHSALTSGSFVIQFLDDVLWEESDLNIYIQKGEACLEFSRYLCEEEGYRVVKAWNADDEDEEYAGYEIINVCMLSLSKCVRASQLTLIIKFVTYKRPEEDTEIRIACTHDTPLSSILRGFHTTALLNVMTWNMSYSLFPETAFLSPRETYPLQEMLYPDKDQEFLAKYEKRGWCCPETIPSQGRSLSSLDQPSGSRQLCDSKTWKMALDVSGVEASSAVPDFVLECSEFRIWKPRPGGGFCIDTFPTESCVLRHNYLASYLNHWPSWLDFLQSKSDALTRIELEKLSEEEMPQFMRGPNIPNSDFYSFNDNFEKPTVWTFYDELVPQWLEEWLKTERETVESDRWRIEG